MSATTGSDDTVEVPPPAHFAARADRGDPEWVEDAITAYLGLTLGPKQREVCRSVVEHEQTAVVGANGTGKSYITAAIALAWQTVRYPAITFGTSGTGKKLYRTLCRPIDKLHGQALGGAGLPGEFKQQPPRIDYPDPEHYFEAATPADAGELEGAHNAYTLAIIEECDKDDVTPETVDAMRSLVPDYETGRVLAVGNPPKDETNVFADLVDADSWHTIRMPSWESQNVLVETGQREGDHIDGMATVSALRKDWDEYHDEPWPGVDQTRRWSDPDHPDFRDDLDARWYRRRAGVMPPQGSEAWRPIDAAAVSSAYARSPTCADTPDGLGLDVARSGDRTALVGAFGPTYRVIDTWQGTDYPEQESAILQAIGDWPDAPLIVDAVGEGSGLADYLADRHPRVVRFRSGGKPDTPTEYRTARAEAMHAFGQHLADGASIDHHGLREECMVAARVTRLDTRHLSSRGRNGAEVIEINSKDAITKRLGRSPDLLDASMMARYGVETQRGGQPIAFSL